MIAENIKIQSCSKDGILAVLITAHINPIASNYNRIPCPPVVMVTGGKSFTAVRCKTVEDIILCDIQVSIAGI